MSGGVGKCPGRSSMRGGGWTARTEFKWPPCGARRSAAAASAVDERCATEVIDQRNIAQGGRADERAMYGRDYRSQSPDGRTEGRRAPWPAGVSAGRRQDARGTSRGGCSDDDDDESLISGTDAHSQRHHHAARVWRETDGQRIAVS